MNGKGNTPRPLAVSQEEFAKRWNNTFSGNYDPDLEYLADQKGNPIRKGDEVYFSDLNTSSDGTTYRVIGVYRETNEVLVNKFGLVSPQLLIKKEV